MPSQNNSGAQHQKDDSTTVVATTAVVASRFIAYDGGYATAAGGVKDAQGIGENDAAAGDAISVVTCYSYTLEASAPIAFGDYVMPAADATGRGAVGTLLNHCGRALGAATAAGQLVEVQIVRHVHP